MMARILLYLHSSGSFRAGLIQNLYDNDAELMIKSYAFLNNEQGVTAIEYAIMGLLIVVVIVAAVTALGGKVLTLYSAIAGAP